MSLEKLKVIGKMEVGELCDISIRTDTVIIDTDENGVSKEVSRSFHRHVVVPGDDVSEEAESVQSTTNALWTPEVIAAWEAAHPAPAPEPEPGPELIEEPVEESNE